MGFDGFWWEPDMVGRDGQIALVLQALDDVQIGPAGDPCETPQPQI